ncbi:MAG: winged helix-turn-helix domain-containing protein [Nanobdellota archaeon]
MKEFDTQEKALLRELVANPRLSDNQIGKRTGIPVKTVNRKRKSLEEQRILNYMTYVDYGEGGTGQFRSQIMYMIKFRYGITTLQLRQKFQNILANHSLVRHTLFSSIGEEDGHVVLVLILESGQHSDAIEIFNAEIMPTIGNFFGTDAVASVNSIPLRREFKFFHNYLPGRNIEKGILKGMNHNIFV